MKFTHFLLAFLLAFSVIGCKEEPKTEAQKLNSQEYLIRDDFKTDEETWKKSDERVRMYGCEEWKKRDPNADC